MLLDLFYVNCSSSYPSFRSSLRDNSRDRNLRLLIVYPVLLSRFLFAAKPEAADGDEESAVASWELRVEGRLLDEAKVRMS